MGNPHHINPHHIYVSIPESTLRVPVRSLGDARAVFCELSGKGIGAGDVVFVSTCAHERVAEAISRCGAELVFVDVTLETWNVSAEVLDLAARWCLSVGSTPRALVLVDAQGLRFVTDALRNVCWKYDMALIENRLVDGGSERSSRPPAVVARRREIHARYRRGLTGTPGLRFVPVVDSAAWNPWLTCVVFEEFAMRDRVRAALGEETFESSLVRRPLHTVPAFADATAIVDGPAEYLFENGLRLPNASTLTDAQVDEVVETVVAVMG
jgi:dTDP-4-amino-4,6-dideoxygalactose transaminase